MAVGDLRDPAHPDGRAVRCGHRSDLPGEALPENQLQAIQALGRSQGMADG